MTEKNKTFCIIGAGTYGCYLANALSEKFPESVIYMIEAGNKNIQSEGDIGFNSTLSKEDYKAATQGRFFGLGGTSAKWGGQLLFFGKNDFKNSPGGMEAMVDNNITYKDKVLNRFFNHPPLLKEEEIEDNIILKQGIWLDFRKRNLFNTFHLKEKKNIHVITNYRVTRIFFSGNAVTYLLLNNKTETKEFRANVYYLTAGALESLRLLAVSGITDISGSAGFSDHISLRCFEVMNSSGKIGPVDFRFAFKGGSMITSRLTGEIENSSFYAHPIFNESFILFQLLKQIIFKGKFSLQNGIDALKQIPAFFPFVYRYLVKKNLYIYRSWYLNIDVEISESKNIIRLSDNKDAYGEAGIDIEYFITDETIKKLLLAKEKVKKFLEKSGVDFKELNGDATSVKVEDVYHPFSLFHYKKEDTIESVNQPLSNLILFNTGLLRRAGAINPTASLFCLIEQHIESFYKESSNQKDSK